MKIRTTDSYYTLIMKNTFSTAVFIFLSITTGLCQSSDTVFTVSQNPFQSSTDLTIHDLNADTVTLNIYKRSGQSAANYFDSVILSGTITVTFFADSLPDDMYLAILTKNGNKHVLKIVKSQTSSNHDIIQNERESILVYPNPTDGRLTLSSENKIEGVEIYDISGKQLHQSNKEELNQINIANFKSGLYLMFVKTNAGTFIEKIIKR